MTLLCSVRVQARNILLKSSGGAEGRPFTAKVADFGLSMRIDANATHVSNVYQGTMTHMVRHRGTVTRMLGNTSALVGTKSQQLLSDKSKRHTQSFGTVMYRRYMQSPVHAVCHTGSRCLGSHPVEADLCQRVGKQPASIFRFTCLLLPSL